MVRVSVPTANMGCDQAEDASGSVHAAKLVESPTPPTSVESTAFDWDPDSVVAARQSRSQSLTDPRTMATLVRNQSTLEEVSPSVVTAVAVDGDTSRSVAFVVVDDARDDHHTWPRMRRTRSVDMGCSLSLLQQELGYPRAMAGGPFSGSSHDSGNASSCTARTQRSSRRNSVSSIRTHDGKAHGRPAATSDAPTLVTSDYADEEDTRDHEREDEEENFLDHRLASVTGYARDTDGIVYYEIVVESTAHGPLSAYKVRRRYSEFRELHRALAKIMPTRAPKKCSSGDSRASMGGIGDFNPAQFGERSTSKYHRHSDAGMYATRIAQSLHEASRSTESDYSHTSTSAWLPPLPDSGGLWSFFQSDSTRFLENRARAFHTIILAAQQHPQARASRLLNKFLGPPPDSFASNHYVSLNRFAAPTLRFSIEIHERKEMAKTISRRRRQRHSHSTSPSSSVPPSIAE